MLGSYTGTAHSVHTAHALNYESFRPWIYILLTIFNNDPNFSPLYNQCQASGISVEL